MASFIGEATLLPVKRTGNGSVTLGETILRTNRSIPQAGELFLAVQAEKLLIDHEGHDPARNVLSGYVTDIVFQGESLRIFLALDNGMSLSLRQPRHHESSRLIPPVGARLNVRLHPEDTIVVAKATE